MLHDHVQTCRYTALRACIALLIVSIKLQSKDCTQFGTPFSHLHHIFYSYNTDDMRLSLSQSLSIKAARPVQDALVTREQCSQSADASLSVTFSKSD